MRIKRIYNVRPSRDQDKDWRPIKAPDGAPPSLPPSVDLRATWWPAESQGSTGACVGFAVGEGLVRWHATMAGKLTQGVRIAWRPIWMGSKEEDILWRPASFIDSWGTYVKDALDFVRKYGTVNMSQWGGSSAKTYAGSYNTFYANASNMKISAYWNLGGGNPSGWREWLANNGPVVVRLDIDRQFERVYSNTVVTLDNFVPGSGKGHAVCLVGYREDGSFIVRNSWGKYWGDGGHVYVTERYAAAAFDESYGITL